MTMSQPPTPPNSTAPENPPTEPPLRLVNIYSNEPCEKIYATISKPVYTYFFRKLFAGETGQRQCLIAFFFQRLYEECQRQNIHPSWDELNEPRVAAILNKLNFRDSADWRATWEGSPAAPVDHPGRPARTRRTGARSPEPQAQCDAGVRKSRTARTARSPIPSALDEPDNTDLQT